MRLKLVSIGRERADPTAPLVADYVSRIQRFTPIDNVVLKPDRAVRIAAKILKEQGKGRLLVALDDGGEQPTSRGLAKIVASWMERGLSQVTLVIGGADGLPRDVHRGADQLLSLSKLTLPHRLARLVLVEQLYRAICIIRNVPYDK
ncbi:MAG: 23S rRNA (pseudouridine(1915)-N(3))-methyltransferase RlmH [Deltaproteobacteria bacterium]|nr:23S rRNA (pseudouridine(1915)-N(3))-methyltransferase RlmH [Deltaproteobacteria bacterium]